MPAPFSNEDDQPIQDLEPETPIAPPPAYNDVAYSAAADLAFDGSAYENQAHSEKF